MTQSVLSRKLKFLEIEGQNYQGTFCLATNHLCCLLNGIRVSFQRVICLPLCAVFGDEKSECRAPNKANKRADSASRCPGTAGLSASHSLPISTLSNCHHSARSAWSSFISAVACCSDCSCYKTIPQSSYLIHVVLSIHLSISNPGSQAPVNPVGYSQPSPKFFLFTQVC